MGAKISVIIPVYNNEKYFPNAVKSVLEQSYQNFELIIVDDGSTDNTPKIADEFASKDSRIKVIHQENQWIYASFNNGIEVASGDYILILNSDDKINKESLFEISKEAELNFPDMILYNIEVLYCDTNQNIITSDLYHRKNQITSNFHISGNDSIKKSWGEFLRKKLIDRQCIYKTDIAKQNLFRNDIYMADQFYNMNIVEQLNSVSGISYVVYNQFIYNTSRNASVGKYYGYEHDMFNEFFSDYKRMFFKWGLIDENEDVLYSIRLSNLTSEFKKYSALNCRLTSEQKIQKIFFESIDDVVYECGVLSGRKEELEARILSACRDIFVHYVPDKNAEIRFIYDMLESLLRYEKTDKDIECIKNAVYHDLNKNNIGICFYKKIKGALF